MLPSATAPAYYLRMNADMGACSRRLPDDQVDLVVEVFRMLADATRVQVSVGAGEPGDVGQ